jgi:hypothetical protein
MLQRLIHATITGVDFDDVELLLAAASVERIILDGSALLSIATYTCRAGQ